MARLRARRLAVVLIIALVLAVAAASKAAAVENVIALDPVENEAVIFSKPFRGPDFSNYSDIARNDVPTWFETRGAAVDIIAIYGKYVEVGPLCYEARPGGMLEGLLKSSSVRNGFGAEIDGWNGIAGLRERTPEALDGMRVLLRDPDFIKQYFLFMDRECEWMESEIFRRYGVDLTRRGELVMGLFRTFFNNRKNDVFFVVPEMLAERTAEEIDSMSDAVFAAAAHKAMIATLSVTLAGKERKDAVIQNHIDTFKYITPHIGMPYITARQKIEMTAAALESHLRDTLCLIPGLSRLEFEMIIEKTAAEIRDRIVVGEDGKNLKMMQAALVGNVQAALDARNKPPLVIARRAEMEKKIPDFRPTPPLVATVPKIIGAPKPPKRGLLAKAEALRATWRAQGLQFGKTK